LVKRVLPFTSGKIPLAVGFGISKPEHIKPIIEAGADGVVVGSAFVNIVQKNLNNPASTIKKLGQVASKLKAATIKRKMD